MIRRTLLGGFAALAPATVLAANPVPATLRRVSIEWGATIPPTSDVELTAEEIAAGTVPTLDADLIRLCAAHAETIRAAEHDSTYENNCPLWQAYERSRDAISAAVPVTMAGVLAKARAAKAEARNADGMESPANCPAETWAWDLVNDLLRLEGRV